MILKPTPQQRKEVAAWRAWNKRSAARHARGGNNLQAGERADPMPPLPSDHAFRLVDGRISDTVVGT
jgi:hypothetical protein